LDTYTAAIIARAKHFRQIADRQMDRECWRKLLACGWKAEHLDRLRAEEAAAKGPRRPQRKPSRDVGPRLPGTVTKRPRKRL